MAHPSNDVLELAVPFQPLTYTQTQDTAQQPLDIVQTCNVHIYISEALSPILCNSHSKGSEATSAKQTTTLVNQTTKHGARSKLFRPKSALRTNKASSNHSRNRATKLSRTSLQRSRRSRKAQDTTEDDGEDADGDPESDQSSTDEGFRDHAENAEDESQSNSVNCEFDSSEEEDESNSLSTRDSISSERGKGKGTSCATASLNSIERQISDPIRLIQKYLNSVRAGTHLYQSNSLHFDFILATTWNRACFAKMLLSRFQLADQNKLIDFAEYLQLLRLLCEDFAVDFLRVSWTLAGTQNGLGDFKVGTVGTSSTMLPSRLPLGLLNHVTAAWVKHEALCVRISESICPLEPRLDAPVSQNDVLQALHELNHCPSRVILEAQNFSGGTVANFITLILLALESK